MQTIKFLENNKPKRLSFLLVFTDNWEDTQEHNFYSFLK